MTTATAAPARHAAPSADAAPRPRWTWLGVGAGVLGFVATMVTGTGTSDPGVGPNILDDVSQRATHIGGALGYVAVAILLVLAACWRTRIIQRVPDNVAARLVADGLVASAAALTFGYGWKLALSLYGPGGPEDDAFGREGQFVYYMLNDFGPWIGYLGVVVAAGAVAWLGLRDRLVSKWLGIVSLIPPLAVLFMSCTMSIAGFPGVVGPVWLIIAFAGLSLGKHQLTGTVKE
ncbi:DUF4386 family protein [Frankia nepalensis]|uniref:DUF4386 family protein n=1 Tax=Frankia nepalensis TaxID=1836974 RepID=A0A937UPS2_9ACTN|nr:DUF4386 family protein [Frankia nepalensis]MBL7516082.1 DUF4386 family protein [Frankia nepalensis]MBL7625876.1 DUF4386 family protein [Frankia nepalensis]